MCYLGHSHCLAHSSMAFSNYLLNGCLVNEILHKWRHFQCEQEDIKWQIWNGCAFTSACEAPAQMALWCFPGEAPLCNGYSLRNSLCSSSKPSGSGSNKGIALWATRVPSLSGRAASSVGGPLLAFPPLCAHSLRFSCLFCVSRALGISKKSTQKCKTTLLLKELSEWERTMNWLES